MGRTSRRDWEELAVDGLMQGKGKEDPDREARQRHCALGPWPSFCSPSRWRPALDHCMLTLAKHGQAHLPSEQAPASFLLCQNPPLVLQHAAQTHPSPRRGAHVAQGQTTEPPGLERAGRSSQRWCRRAKRQQPEGSGQCLYQQWPNVDRSQFVRKRSSRPHSFPLTRLRLPLLTRPRRNRSNGHRKTPPFSRATVEPTDSIARQASRTRSATSY